MSQYVIFIKSVPFLQIEEGEPFKVLYDGDNRPYIVKKKLKIYMTDHRKKFVRLVETKGINILRN